MLKLYFKKKSFKTMIAILTIILCFSSFNIQAKQNSNTLNSLPQGSYQLARAVFLPNANDDVWLSHYSSIPFHYQRNENCEKFGFTLPSCPPHGKCLSCPIDPKYKKLITCLTDGDQKYKISDSGTYCEAYCDVETCDTSKYFSYSCPEGTVCESCTAVTSKCAKTPWYKPTTNCLLGYHYDSGRCVKDCQVIGCGGGTGMDRTFQDKCPTGYICTSLSNEYQTSDCKKGKCFKYKSCDTANGYTQQGSPGYCEYQECYKTQTSCAAYSLNTCPENGNCSECTVQYADCSEGDKKYKLDSCKAGYQMINNSYCAKTCSAKTCDTTEYFMTTCPENMDCESCTSVTTSCEESQRFKLGPCKSGYHADSLGRCVSDCEKISCGDLWGINRTFQDKCPTGYICTTLSNEYQTSDCQRGKCFKYKSCDTENGYAQLGSPGECTYQDCYQSQTTCSGYTLDSCPQYGHCTECTVQYADCSTGATKYRLDSCDMGYSIENGQCVKSCTENSCKGYTLSSCPANADCEQCLVIDSNCSSQGTKYKFLSCQMGFHLEGEKCLPNCTESTCDGYTLSSCPEKGFCSQCQTQTTDCTKGEIKFKLDTCEDDYVPQNGKCVQTCTKETCTGYTLSSCPENANCNECTITDTDCSTSGTKYQFVSCKSGYHEVNRKCEPNCTQETCFGYNLTSCPEKGNCSQCQTQSTDCIKGDIKFKLDSCESGYTAQNGKCVQTCTKETCTGYTLASCPENANCNECTITDTDCSTSGTKYQLISCQTGYHEVNGKCEKDCTKETCTGYTLSSCPENANCNECTITDTDCSTSGTKYQFVSCKSGFHEVNGKCEANCTQETCFGYNLTSCPEKGNCSQCQTQSTDCIKGDIKFKLDSCEDDYVPQNGKCVQTCTKETCTGYTLTSCPKNANCNECTITDTDCSTSGTKYQFVSCKSGYHEVNGKCEQNCTQETCFGYNLKSCPLNAECSECTLQTTECTLGGNDDRRYKFVQCKPGYHLEGENCKINCQEETCAGYDLKSCPLNAECSECTLQTTECTLGGDNDRRYKFVQCKPGYHLEGEDCKLDCPKETCTGYTLASCPKNANCNECTITDTDCSTSGTKYQFVSCQSGYHEVNGKCEQNCTQETCFGYNLKSCPLNAECSECTLQTTECTLGGDKNKRYKFSRCKPDFHLEGEECKKDCSEETCAGYDLKSCPLNADCSECKLQSTNCTSAGTRYKYNGCNPGFHEVNGECKPDCPEETCAGYDLKSCPLNADCSVCTLQNSECTLGGDKDKKYKFNGCNLGFHYDSNECVPDCTETCPAFPLYSCPDYGNCSECTVENSDCTDKETKYSLDSCRAGYHIKSNKCEKDCIVGSFGSSGEVISPIFDSREECTSVEGVSYCIPRAFYISTSCNVKQKYFISSCKTGYHKIDKVSSMSGNTYRTLKCEKDCVPNSFGGTVFAASSLYNSRAECTAVEGVSGCITRVVDITTDCERASRYWIYSCKTGYTKKEEVINGETHISCVKNCTPNIQDAYKEGFIITSESAIQNAKYESKEVIINESCGTDTYYKITGCNTGYHPVNGYRQSYYYGIVMCEKDCTGTRTAPSGYRYSSGYFNSQSPMHSIKTQKLTAPNCETTTVYAISSCKIGSVQYTGHCCDKSIEQIGNSYYCCQTSQSSSFTDYRNGKYCRPGMLGNNSSETSAKQIWNETLSKTSREEY